jgi:acyl carrier protein
MAAPVDTHDMESRLQTIFLDLFKVPASALHDGLAPDGVKGWDSLGHLSLIEALEAEFKLTFEDGDLTAMDTVGHIKDVLRRRGA